MKRFTPAVAPQYTPDPEPEQPTQRGPTDNMLARHLMARSRPSSFPMQQAAQTQARIDAQREAEIQAAADAAAAEHRLGPFMQEQLAIAKSRPSRSVSPHEGQLQHYASSTTTTTAAAPPSEMDRLTTNLSGLNLGDEIDDIESRLRGFSITKTAKKGKGKRKGGKKTRKHRRKH